MWTVLEVVLLGAFLMYASVSINFVSRTSILNNLSIQSSMTIMDSHVSFEFSGSIPVHIGRKMAVYSGRVVARTWLRRVLWLRGAATLGVAR